ncbi:MAG: GNAT family N-acetyltransferase [bacterium]
MAILKRGKLCEIRPISRNSLGPVLAVYRACEDFLALGPQPKADMAMVLKDLDGSQQRGGHFCGIHDSTGRMVGVVDYTPRGFEGQHGVAFVSLIMIVPLLRGQRIGTEAVRLIELEIRSDPLVTMVRSAVQVNNPDAKRFWLSRGYQVVGKPEVRPDGTTVHSLHKTFGHCV